ncbi:hypothetical protein [Salegentibacter sp. Hel_I_6]|uniref:hypothetical protein n=1 Tax=Salegentibacter sp. Hel_I_6 TaxID=1250278 RepID=UPI000568A1E4|nr:hypothetical protein [Salegentibacter sp. Hel_I_6]
MAEIKIEKKKPIWPWVILIIILILGILFYVFAYEEDNDTIDDTDNIEELNDTSASVSNEKAEMAFCKKGELIS